MPNQKISELTAIVTVDNSVDVLPIVDISANTTKKVTPNALKTALALDNVNNTSDANKPVSTAQQDALNAKVDENAPIVAATKTKITYDAKGLVTAGDILDAADMPTGINAANIGTGVVSSTEFGYLDGVTSAIQTQINSKQATLVSGTNIKTINSTSLLGSGDITISANPSGVAGAIQFSNGSAFASDAANLFWDDTNNRLGVGTNAPSVPLEGLGNAWINAPASTDAILSIGNPSRRWDVKALQSGAYYQVVYNNGLIGQSIDYLGNVAFGNVAALSARVGIKGSGATSATTSLLVQNSAGTSSLQVTDDGSVFNYGKGALTTNTAFGVSAIGGNNTAGNLSAFGRGALQTNTSGSSNSAFGRNALSANSSGSSNSAFGVGCLTANTSGSNNSSLGVDTSSGNFSGSVILGNEATATANNQFVVGSVGTNAGAVNSTTDVPATFLWSVRINGTNYKILMTT